MTVSVLRVQEQETYSERLKRYFGTLAEYHARPKGVFWRQRIMLTTDSKGEDIRYEFVVVSICLECGRSAGWPRRGT